MRFIGNLIWFFLAGFWLAMAYFILGVLWSMTIIGIPFGLQAFKLGRLSVWPFGKDIEMRPVRYFILNIIWFILGGFAIALIYLAAAFFCMITIVGIPFGIQCLKLAKLSCAPFGARV